MTTLRFAAAGSGHERITLPAWQGEPLNLLISYAYLQRIPVLATRIATWMMDSGAFTAHTLGKPVDLDDFIRACQLWSAVDSRLTEIIALDVIGDHRATMRNAVIMQQRGVDAIPTVHVGATRAQVDDLRGHRKIAIGGLVGRSSQEKRRFCALVFERLWPVRVHALGVSSPGLLTEFPFDSADSADWINSPTRWGRWKSMPGFVPPRGPSRDVSSEIRWYLDLEAQLRVRWGSQLDSLP